MDVDFKPPSMTIKSFWDKPEGKTGMITIALGLVGGVIALKEILPILISVMSLGVVFLGKAVLMTITGFVLFILWYIITNRKFQTLLSYIFKSAMRAVTSIFVEIDPIGIMKSYIEDLRDKREVMQSSIGKLNGQIAACRTRMAKMSKDHDKAIATAAQAKEKDLKSAFVVNARQASRLKQSTITLEQLLNTMELHLRVLRKYLEVSDTVIADIENEVEIRTEERKMILASYGAMKTAMAIINGDKDKKALFDEAMEFVVNDYGMKLGEIENFMESSKSFVEGLDLQNGVYEAEALEAIQAWEKKSDSLLLGDDKRLLIEASAQVPQATPVIIDADYETFFSKKGI